MLELTWIALSHSLISFHFICLHSNDKWAKWDGLNIRTKSECEWAKNSRKWINIPWARNTNEQASYGKDETKCENQKEEEVNRTKALNEEEPNEYLCCVDGISCCLQPHLLTCIYGKRYTFLSKKSIDLRFPNRVLSKSKFNFTVQISEFLWFIYNFQLTNWSLR